MTEPTIHSVSTRDIPTLQENELPWQWFPASQLDGLYPGALLKLRCGDILMHIEQQEWTNVDQAGTHYCVTYEYAPEGTAAQTPPHWDVPEELMKNHQLIQEAQEALNTKDYEKESEAWDKTTTHYFSGFPALIQHAASMAAHQPDIVVIPPTPAPALPSFTTESFKSCGEAELPWNPTHNANADAAQARFTIDGVELTMIRTTDTAGSRYEVQFTRAADGAYLDASTQPETPWAAQPRIGEGKRFRELYMDEAKDGPKDKITQRYAATASYGNVRVAENITPHNYSSFEEARADAVRVAEIVGYQEAVARAEGKDRTNSAHLSFLHMIHDKPAGYFAGGKSDIFNDAMYQKAAEMADNAKCDADVQSTSARLEGFGVRLHHATPSAATVDLPKIRADIIYPAGLSSETISDDMRLVVQAGMAAAYNLHKQNPEAFDACIDQGTKTLKLDAVYRACGVNFLSQIETMAHTGTAWKDRSLAGSKAIGRG